MSTEINMGEKPKRLHIGLTGSILIALGLGLLCGVIFHYLVPAGTVRDDVFVNGIFYIVGQGFIRLMQMLVVPLVFCSIVCGASSIGDTKTLGTIGLKTLVFYLCTTALAVNDIMMKMTSMVMYVAPIGVFCLLARTFANIGFDAFLPMVKYMLGVLLALAVQCLVVYMVLLTVFARINPVKFLKKFVSVMMFAFSTATSNATIPLNIETLEKKMGVDRRISSFTIPLGATINMDGTSIMQGVAVVFTAQLFGVQLGPVEYATVIATATLASIGTAGVPSVGLITLSMVFNSVGLPLEGIALIMGIDRILDMTRTAVNITGDAVCTTIVAKRAGRMDTDVFNDPNAGRELDDVKAA